MGLTRHTSRDAGCGPEIGAVENVPKLHVVTFGCQMNRYDSHLVEGRFVSKGYALTDSMEEADVVLFNTCSVRDHAEERVYSWLGKLRGSKHRRPGLVIGVMGCMAQRVQFEIFKRAGFVDLVVGTRRLQHLPELVSEVRRRRQDPEAWREWDKVVLDVAMDAEVRVERRGETYQGGVHGFLTVMRGCDLNCTYCVVPTTRGRVQSRSVDELVDEARWMVDQGARAITLLGQTVNSYGEDLAKPAPSEREWRGRQGRPSLADLLYRLQELPDLKVLRLVTLHPAYVTQALAQAIADCDKLDRFLPLPIQAGADSVLRSMKRGYTLDLYRGRVDLLRSAVPDLELCSDWIVGFPGESEADFENSQAMLREIGFLQNYIFKYDPRRGTAAFSGKDDVSAEQKQARNQRLLATAQAVQLQRMQRFVGQDVQVFVEGPLEQRPGFLLTRTRHGVPMPVEGGPELIGKQLTLRVTHATAFNIGGERRLAPAAVET